MSYVLLALGLLIVAFTAYNAWALRRVHQRLDFRDSLKDILTEPEPDGDPPPKTRHHWKSAAGVAPVVVMSEWAQKHKIASVAVVAGLGAAAALWAFSDREPQPPIALPPSPETNTPTPEPPVRDGTPDGTTSDQRDEPSPGAPPATRSTDTSDPQSTPVGATDSGTSDVPSGGGEAVGAPRERTQPEPEPSEPDPRDPGPPPDEPDPPRNCLLEVNAQPTAEVCLLREVP